MPLAPSVAVQLFEGLAGELLGSGPGSEGADGHRDYTMEFRVITKDRNVGPVLVKQAPGVPLMYSPYIRGNGIEFDLNAFLTAKSARREKDDDWAPWIVTCNYSTRMPEGGPVAASEFGSPDQQSGSSNNPELEPPSIEWDFEEVQVALAKDRNGMPFVNSARQPFTPAPTFPESYPVLTFSRNELVYYRSTAVKYAYAVNSKPFLGSDIGTAQVLPPKAVLQWKGTLSYYRMTYRIRFKDKNAHQWPDWQPHILDAGTMELQDKEGAPKKGQPVPIYLNNVQITQPVLLDGKGKQAKEEQGLVFDPNVGNGVGGVVPGKLIKPRYRDFVVYQYMDLNNLLKRGLGALLGG